MKQDYGYKQAQFLRGKIVDRYEMTQKFEDKINEKIKNVQLKQINGSELKQYKNSLIFLKTCLGCTEGIPVLLTLKCSDQHLKNCNLSNIHFENYMISVEEMVDYNVKALTSLFQDLSQKILNQPYLQYDTVSLIDKNISSLLKTFKSKPKIKEVLNISKSRQFSGDIPDLIKLVHKHVHSRIDFLLVDFKFASYFSQIMTFKGDKHSAYVILKSAYYKNLKALNFFISNYVFITRLKTYFRKLIGTDVKDPNFEIFRSRNLEEWVSDFRGYQKRVVYLENYHEKMKQIIKVSDMRKTIRRLAELSLEFNDLEESIKFREILIQLYVIIDSFKMINTFGSKELQKNQRVISTLELNKQIILLKIQVFKIAILNQNFEICFLYFAMIMFIYNNSISMINDTDPNKYAKKNQNQYFENDNLFDDALEGKKTFLDYLNFFNDKFKVTQEFYALLLRKLEKTDKKISNLQFLLIKNANDDINDMNTYTWNVYEQYVLQFHASYYLQRHSTKIELHSYQRNFIGVINWKSLEIYVNWKLLHIFGVSSNSGSHSPSFVLTKIKNLNLVNEIKKELNKKLNYNHVMDYLDYKHFNLKILSEIMSYSIYMSKKITVNNTLEELGQKSRHTMLYKKMQDIESIITTKIVVNEQDETLVNLKIDHYLDRIAQNLTQNQQEYLKSQILEVKDQFIKIKPKPIQKKKYDTEEDLKAIKTGPKKLISCWDEIHKNPDLGIGITLRSRGSYIKKQVKPSLFMRGKVKEVRKIQEKYFLQQYQESNELRKLYNPLPIHDYPDFGIQQLLLKDNINIHQNTSIYYELRYLYSQKIQKQKEIIQLLKKESEDLIEKKNKSKYPQTILGRQDSINSQVIKDFEILHLDQTISFINQLNFRFTSLNSERVTSYCLMFELKQDMIGFRITFDQGSYSQSQIYFYLPLKYKLWELKEKYMVSQNRTRSISTYFPVVHSLLTDICFKPIFSHFNFESNSIFKNDIQWLDYLKDPMALKYPILLTKLKDYDSRIMNKIKMKNISKNDLDSMQCLLEIFNLLGKCFERFIFASKVGKVIFPQLNLGKIRGENLQILRDLNKMVILNHKLDNFEQEYEVNKVRILFDCKIDKMNFSIANSDIVLLFDSLSTQMSLTSNLTELTYFTKILNNKSNKTIMIHLARRLIRDENKQYHFLNMECKVEYGKLESKRAYLIKSLNRAIKISEKQECILSSSQFYLLILIMILDSCFKFEFTFDNFYAHSWVRVINGLPTQMSEDLKKTVHEQLNGGLFRFQKKEVDQLKKAIIETEYSQPIVYTKSYLSLLDILYLNKYIRYNKFPDIGKKVEFSFVEEVIYNSNSLMSDVLSLALRPFHNKIYTNIFNFIHRLSLKEGNSNRKYVNCYHKFKQLIQHPKQSCTIKELSFFNLDYRMLNKHIPFTTNSLINEFLKVYGRDKINPKIRVDFMNGSNAAINMLNFNKKKYIPKNKFDSTMNINTIAEINLKGKMIPSFKNPGITNKTKLMPSIKDLRYQKTGQGGSRIEKLESIFSNLVPPSVLKSQKVNHHHHYYNNKI